MPSPRLIAAAAGLLLAGAVPGLASAAPKPASALGRQACERNTGVAALYYFEETAAVSKYADGRRGPTIDFQATTLNMDEDRADRALLQLGLAAMLSGNPATPVVSGVNPDRCKGPSADNLVGLITVHP